MSYCIVTNQGGDWDAYVVSRFSTEDEAKTNCQPGQWVEFLPDTVEFRHWNGEWM